MNVIVAGGSGRLGRRVLAALAARRIPCTALVRAGPNASSAPASPVRPKRGGHPSALSPKRRQALAGLFPARVQVREADYSDIDSLRTALSDATHVINCLGLVSDSASENELMVANALMVRHLLQACPANLRRFVSIGSISVYGFHPPHGANEFAPRKPDTAYGRSKLAGEREVLAWAHRLPVVVLQPGMIYGPGFHEGFWPMLSKLRLGRVSIIGSGKNVLPLVHVEDVVRGVLAALKARVPSGSVFLLVHPQRVAQKEALAGAAHALGVPAPDAHVPLSVVRLMMHGHRVLSHLKVRSGAARRSSSLSSDMIRQLSSDRVFDCRRAVRLLGWHPAMAFKDGLAQVVREFKASPTGQA